MPVAVTRRRKVKSRCLLVKAFWILRVVIECANSCFDEGLRCLTDLRVTDPRDDKKRIEDTKGGLLKGSYKWILAHPDYLQWRDGDQSRLLWVKGDPGKGKTMLLIGIVNELEQELAQPKHTEQSTSHTEQSTSKVDVLSYFFCQGTDSNLNNAVAVLRGLIFLLAAQQPSLVSHLRDKYNHSGPKLFEGANAFFALSDILGGMLRDPSLARAYLVIDALDECQTDLQRLLKLIVDNTSASRVKWIVSSRNRPDIEQHLKLDGSQTRLELELKANAEHVSLAVSAYIDEKVSRLVSLQDDDELRHNVADVLRRKADGTFLWVALVVQELQKVERWYVLDVLREMPSGLEELYGRMIKQIQQLKRRDPEFCRLVLSAAILAYRPLHMLELGALAGLPVEIAGKSESVQTIVRMCGSFLTVRGDQVYIVHQSARDYLSGRGAPQSSSDHTQADRGKFPTSLEVTAAIFPSGHAEAHRGIFLQSLVTMRKSLRRDMYGLRHPGFSIEDHLIPVPDPLASARYSCVHWIDHLCDASQRDVLIDGGPVHNFFQAYFLYWIEASSICGETSDAVFAIAKLERLLNTASIDSALRALTLDAHRFLLYNGPVINRAPLQTYVSALLFSPTASLTRKLFQKEAPQWVLTGPTTDERWSPLVRTLEDSDGEEGSVAFSLDGKLMASPSDDGTIKVWDAATGDVVRMLEGHGDSVTSVAFSPDGKLITSASFDGTVKVWDAATGDVVRTLEGHGDCVYSVAFSPDGKLLASASDNWTVKVWDAPSGDVVRTLEGHGDSVTSVAFSPDGKLLASASDDGTIKVWDAATGDIVRTLEGHGDWVTSVAFSPDGKMIASASRDETVKVWNVATGDIVRTLEGHRGSDRSVAFSPDGKMIASASRDKTVKVWNVATGDIVRTLEGHRNWVRSVAFSPDGKLIASASDDGTVKVWDVATRDVMRTVEGHGDSVTSVAFSPDGKLLASASSDGAVKVWDAATGDVVRTLEGHGDWVYSVAFSPDGKMIASASSDGTVKVWKAATGDIVRTLEGHDATVRSVAFSPDGQLIASASDGTVKVWDAATGDIVRTIEGHGAVRSVAFSLDSKLVASASYDWTVKVWNAATGDIVRTIEGHGAVRSVTFSPDSNLVASASYNKTVKVWDAATGDVVRMLEGHGDSVYSVAFSPDGKLITSASFDGTVKVWDAATGDVVRTLEGHGDWVYSVAFSPDGKLLASASDDGTIKVWDAPSGEIVRTLEGHGDCVYSVAFSPDGKLLASASDNWTVKVWDAPSGDVVRTLEGHGDSVTSVAFSPDGKMIASASRDETVKVWNVATGDIVRTLEGHRNWVRSVAFSPDGKLIASASDDWTVKVWDAPSGDVVRTLEGHDATVRSVAFSPDGRLIASASSDGTAKVWNAATGDVVRTLYSCRHTASFDTTVPKLFGDTGYLRLDDVTQADHTAAWNLGATESRIEARPQTMRQFGYGLSLDESWITWNGDKVLWLPPECRPSCSATWCSAAPSLMERVAIGCPSGRVIVIGFSGPPPGLTSSES